MRNIILTNLLFWLFATSTAAAVENLRNFGGVGIDGMPWADGRIVVKQLVAGGPAHLAGIKVGDIITHIDGKQTKGSKFSDMVDHRLRGKAGTKVRINIIRPGEAIPRVFILIRRQLVVQPSR